MTSLASKIYLEWGDKKLGVLNRIETCGDTLLASKGLISISDIVNFNICKGTIVDIVYEDQVIEVNSLSSYPISVGEPTRTVYSVRVLSPGTFYDIDEDWRIIQNIEFEVLGVRNEKDKDREGHKDRSCNR
jgi:hypothetical protein